MNHDKTGFSIEQQYGVTCFKNETKFKLEISLVPVKPKRKYTTIMMIPPGTSRYIDGGEFDLSKVCFRILKEETKE